MVVICLYGTTIPGSQFIVVQLSLQCNIE